MARIKVDLDRTTGTVDRRIFGGFVEHLGRCIYGGVFDEGSPRSDERGFRRDVLEAARALKIPVLRWPGGNFASGYHWIDHLRGIARAAVAARLLGRRVSSVPAQTPTVDGVAAPVSRADVTEYC